ncbi:hypothetical protein [Microbulbifer agarilyticus]
MIDHKSNIRRTSNNSAFLSAAGMVKPLASLVFIFYKENDTRRKAMHRYHHILYRKLISSLELQHILSRFFF